MSVPAPMGTGTAINFQPTGERKAAITGDLVLFASEVNPVMKTLRQNGIEVPALHSHMVVKPCISRRTTIRRSWRGA